MAAFIIGAEAGFWVLLAAGLAARYLLRLRRTSTVLLLSVPIVDVVVLTAAVIDMRGGAVADLTHVLSALYLGFSIVFGHRTIRWVDRRVAHRFAGGPPPVKPPKYGTPRVIWEWRQSALWVLAWALSVVVVYAMVLMVGDTARTDPLVSWIWSAGKIAVIAVLWALAYTIWPPKPKGRGKDGTAPASGPPPGGAVEADAPR